MYNPPAFRENRRDALHELIRQHSFGTLVSLLDGELFATHLPFLLHAERGEHGTLVGHLARANPHWRAFENATGAAGDAGGQAAQAAQAAHGDHAGVPARRPPTDRGVEALAIFQGPHAYISPSWYETEPAVPTWNYVAVHASGRARIVDHPAAVRRVLRDLVNTYESPFPRPWSMDGLPDEYMAKMAAGIVVFEIEITRLEGKRKLSQNKPAADRQGAAAGLRRQGDPVGVSVAALMDALD